MALHSVSVSHELESELKYVSAMQETHISPSSSSQLSHGSLQYKHKSAIPVLSNQYPVGHRLLGGIDYALKHSKGPESSLPVEYLLALTIQVTQLVPVVLQSRHGLVQTSQTFPSELGQ